MNDKHANRNEDGQVNLWTSNAVDGPPPEVGGVSEPPDSGGDASASPRLEDYNNKRNYKPTGRVYLRPCNCRCRVCKICGPKFGIKVRCRLLEKLKYFPRPAMFTLTVDRDALVSPVNAFNTITEGGYIRRLMRLLKVEYWAWTLELQMKTGEGWPHWHMVINLPPAGIDLERAWRLWRDKWHLGGLDLQRKPNRSAEHAMFYVTKYLTKYPDAGFPGWILHHPKRIRWVGGTRSIGRLVSDREPVAKDAKDDTQAKESLPRVHRPLAMRLAECGQIVNFFVETECAGEVYQSFFGRLPLEQVIAATHKRSMLPVFKDEDGKAYLMGQWDSFVDLANDIMEQANRAPGKCTHHWSTTQRFKDYRNAEYLTHQPDWGNDQ